MEARIAIISLLSASILCIGVGAGATYSLNLIHRFSDEARSFWAPAGSKPNSSEHLKLLLSGDLNRQRLKFGSQKQLLVPSEGSQTVSYGNDWGWLHYTWIDIGTPNVSFFVALDAGSDLFWVPCDCIQCAPLSSSYYDMLDRELSQYIPSRSSTSKHLSCGHQLCELGPNCKASNEHCPYNVEYYSDNTSSSGFLFEDQLHLLSVSGSSHGNSFQAPVIVGCGSKQSGSYLDGIAPDGLLGLGPGEISVPSMLAKSGIVKHSFSFCFDKSFNGRILFGDQGPATQRFTPFSTFEGKYIAYIVEVEHYCFGSSCLKQTGFQAQVDTGSSFTYLPNEVYSKVVVEFDGRMNAPRSSISGFPYCYESRSLDLSNIPGMKLMFAFNQSFVIENPMFPTADDQDVDFHCLGVQPINGGMGIIGQNFMMGYNVVFDLENLKLGWSHSNCQDVQENNRGPAAPSNMSVSPLPTNEQQKPPNGHAVAPAVAGRTPSKPSAAPPRLYPNQYSCACLLLLLWTVSLRV